MLGTTNRYSDVNVDWDFLEIIHENRNTIPNDVKEEERVNFQFNPSRYHDAVIMPWYRNRDQPQVNYFS